MANKRMINGYVWEDEFFLTLTMFQRLLWIGLLTAAADDQGRMMDSAAMIRSKVFPIDDISLAEIESALKVFAEAGKIDRYKQGGKKAIQIVNWWKHQRPRWAGESTLPAPEGWVDRYRYQATGGGIAELNWKEQGGYIADSLAPGTINKVNIKDKVKDNDKDNNSAAAEIPHGAPSPNFTALQDAYTQLTGQTYPSNPKSWIAAFKAMDEAGILPEDLQAAHGWKSEKGYNVRSPSSLHDSANRAKLERTGKLKVKSEEPQPQYNYKE